MAILGYPTTTTSAAPARHLQHTTPNKTKQEKTTTTTKYNRFASLAKFNKQPKSADAIRNR